MYTEHQVPDTKEHWLIKEPGFPSFPRFLEWSRKFRNREKMDEENILIAKLENKYYSLFKLLNLINHSPLQNQVVVIGWQDKWGHHHDLYSLLAHGRE